MQSLLQSFAEFQLGMKRSQVLDVEKAETSFQDCNTDNCGCK